MAMKKWQKVLASVIAVVAVLAFVVWDNFETILMTLPRIVLEIKDPIRPYREIQWQQGPAVAAAPVSQRPPNIVFILADDMGWNDVTLHGKGIADGAVPTPHINSIAQQGVEFSDGYAPNATCAPSRAALMTGRYGTRFGFEYTPTPDAMLPIVKYLYKHDPHLLRQPIAFKHEGKTPKFDEMGLPTDEITIAQLLKQVGYHTVQIGKWHLGERGKFAPYNRGFDESLQLADLLHMSEDDPNVVNGYTPFDPIDQFLFGVGGFAVRYNGGVRFKPNEYMADYDSDQAVKVINANRNRPFFLYLAYWEVHNPLQALKSDYDSLPQIHDHTERVYGGMVKSLDRGVGKVLEALHKNGLDDNTLVIFTSDNGAPGYMGLSDVNIPYRGWKMTYFQGGIRVPFYMKWPGHIPAGVTYSKPVQGFDTYTTIAAAAGASLPKNRIIDGVNLVPYVTGKTKADPHQALFWKDGTYRAVIADGWKLQVSKYPEKTWLYDLNNDPTEQHDLAHERPDKVTELQAKLTQWMAQQAPSLWPSTGAVPVAIDKAETGNDSLSDPYVYWSN